MKGKLAIVGVIAGILSAVLSSCATIKLFEEKGLERAAEYQRLKSEVEQTEKALQEHIDVAQPLLEDSLRLIPVLGDRSLRTLSDIQELKASLERLEAKLDRAIEREKERR